MIVNILRICGLLLFASLITSCNHNSQFSPTEAKLVKDSVIRLTANIEKGISTKGPAAWLDYFEDTPDFFMASQGQMAFSGHEVARAFILNTLVKSIPHIKLKWKNVRIDPLSQDIASVGADFHEELTDTSNKTQIVDGYFTATAHHINDNWKLRNAHWSIKAQPNAN